MPMYSYTALNALASNDTGHFVYLDAWSANACLSILEQASPLYHWMNDQNPLSPSEIDDLDAKLAEVQNQLMTPLTGLIMPICTAGVPQGMLLCNGATYQRVDYPLLYERIELYYIIDADSFRVPDLQDKFVLGAGPLHPDGTSGGAAEHTMTIDELVPHSHNSPPHVHSEITAIPTVINGGIEAPASAAQPGSGFTGSTDIIIENTGGGQPMDIMPPFYALRYAVVAS